MIDIKQKLSALKEKRKAVLITCCIIVLICFAIIFAQSYSPTTPKPGTQTPTPTGQQATPATPASIISIQPLPNTQNLSVYVPITVTFSRGLTADEKKALSTSINPEANTTTVWSTDGKTVVYTPLSPLSTSTVYTVQAKLSSDSQTTTFTTVSDNDLSMEDKARIQTQADKEFGDWQKSIYENYPWYDSFPIQETEFFLYFDLDKRAFVGMIYPKVGRNDRTYNAHIENIKNNAKAAVNNRGINPSQYTFEWVVK